MLIAVTSEGLDPSSLVAEKFGSAPFIIFYNIEETVFESLRNPYSNLLGSAGIQTAQLIIEKNTNVVIAINIGINPHRLLRSANVKVYSCTKIQVQKAIKEFIEGKLSVVKQESLQYFGKAARQRRRHRNKDF